MFETLVILFSLVGEITLPPIPDYVQNLFDKAEFEYTSRNSEETIGYRLMLADPLEGDQEYPLLLWLHESSESGNDNSEQLLHLHEAILRNLVSADCPYFILAPQSRKEPAWSDYEGEDGTFYSELTGVSKLLGDVLDRYPVDANRISIIGLGEGGNAALRLATHDSDRFASIIVINCQPAEDIKWNILGETPLWALTARPLAEYSQPIVDLVESVQSIGGQAAHRIIESEPLRDIDEDYPSLPGAAFDEFNLTTWLLSQAKQGEGGMLPGEVSWETFFSWNFIIPRLSRSAPAIFLVVLLWVCFREVRRRKGHSSTDQSDASTTEGEVEAGKGDQYD